MRSEYVQSYLRSLYYWDVSLSPSQAQGLAIDLHDLGYDMNQDVHVYSLSGELLATSSPALFDNGLLSRRMAPQALFTEEHATICYEKIATHPYLVSYVPFHNGSFVTIGYIAIPSFMSEQTRNAEIDALLSRLLPPYILVLLLALFFAFGAAKSVTAPTSLMTDKMRRFEIGGRDNHIEYPYHDELGALVERYNLLVDRVEESAERLARAEREGAWRTMARQIAHEINNPLTPMKLSVQKLQLKRGTDGFDEYFDKTTKMLIAEIDNLAHIAQSFSTFAKQPEVITTEVDVAEKLSNVITLQRANDEQIPVRYVGPDSGVLVRADNEQIAQVFVNIIRNALQALANDQQPAANRQSPDIIVILNAAYSDREVQISISDNGPGIPESIQARIFQPNFTTKSNGNGLGLAISKHIVEGSGGRIEFETSPKGTTFYIYLRKK
jgi:nitrogen fixation/metabolism regulation signal transduction histidine kinase